MGMVALKHNNFHRITALTIDQEYKEVFSDGFGELPGVTSLLFKPNAIPAVMANRRVSVAVQPQLKAELKRLTTMGVIEPMEKPTSWVSQLVTTHKTDGSLRICLNMHELNYYCG